MKCATCSGLMARNIIGWVHIDTMGFMVDPLNGWHRAALR